MIDHDALCPWPDPTLTGDGCSYCELIVAARADERERIAQEMSRAGFQAAAAKIARRGQR